MATFFSGMPPEQIEADITGRFERFFTLASNIEHIESRSLPGVSLIKIYFQPGTDADSAVTERLESGDGQSAPASAGNSAARGAEVRRVQPAGLPDHAEGRGPDRDATARPGSVHGAQPGGERAGRLRAAAVRRTLSPDHGLRRSVEAGGAPAEPHGRGARRQRLQPDSARRRHAHRPVRLQPLTNSQVDTVDEIVADSAQGEGRRSGLRRRHRHRAGRRSRSRPTSCASTASRRSICRC